MGVMWEGGELREREGYFSHLGFQSTYARKPASAGARLRLRGTDQWVRPYVGTGSALVGGNGLEFGVERHMLNSSFPVNLYGISCDAAAATS
jgi:hypothetical protein